MDELYGNPLYASIDGGSARPAILVMTFTLRRCVRLSFCFLARPCCLAVKLGNDFLLTQWRNAMSNALWVVIDTAILKPKRTALPDPIHPFETPLHLHV